MRGAFTTARRLPKGGTMKKLLGLLMVAACSSSVALAGWAGDVETPKDPGIDATEPAAFEGVECATGVVEWSYAIRANAPPGGFSDEVYLGKCMERTPAISADGRVGCVA